MLDRKRSRAYWELTKPGITRMVLVTTAAGFYLGSQGGVDLPLLLHTLLGTGLVAAGTNALNQYWERDVDARMRRTRRRPLPSGRLAPRAALVFASSISIAGIAHLALTVNLRAALVVSLSLASYVFIYTPLKKRTTTATLVGAIPGALPVLAGWVASGAAVGPGAWALFGILFLWQLPHFLSLAWIYRDDYLRGGLATLCSADPDGRRTGGQAFAYTAALVMVSALPWLLGLAGGLYLLAAVALGLGFLWFAISLALNCTERRAAQLFRASIVYLPVLLILMVIDKAAV